MMAWSLIIMNNIASISHWTRYCGYNKDYHGQNSTITCQTTNVGQQTLQYFTFENTFDNNF